MSFKKNNSLYLKFFRDLESTNLVSKEKVSRELYPPNQLS